jgi:hypothetical protein
MGKIFTASAAGLALIGTTIAAAAPADAQRWRGGGGYHGGYRGGGHYYRGNRTGVAIGAGILGLAAGAAIASNRGYGGGIMAAPVIMAARPITATPPVITRPPPQSITHRVIAGATGAGTAGPIDMCACAIAVEPRLPIFGSQAVAAPFVPPVGAATGPDERRGFPPSLPHQAKWRAAEKSVARFLFAHKT